jgi:hypothetical protein
MTLDEIHKLLNSWNTPRVSAEKQVYDLRSKIWPPFVRRTRLHEHQVELIRAVRSLGWHVYLEYEHDPHEWDAKTSWSKSGANTWTVPPGPESEVLLDGYLAPGGWSLYLAPSPLANASVPFLFDLTADEISAFQCAHSMPVLVQAEFDNSEWFVALEPAAIPTMKAA